MSGYIERMMKEVEVVNKQNGWYDEDRRMGEDVALLHSEVSEMLEAWRDYGGGGSVSFLDDDGKPQGIGSEAADIFIRLLDTCSRYDIDLEDEFDRKLTFNKNRDYRHGGKKL